MTTPRKLWWPLRTKQRFLTLISVAWAVLGLIIVVALQVSYTGSVHFVETAFGLFIGGFGGLFWSVAMWELFLKSRVQRILKWEASAIQVDI